MIRHFYWGIAAWRDRSVMKEFRIPNIFISVVNISRFPLRTLDFAERVFVDSGGFQFFTRFNEYPYSPGSYLELIAKDGDIVTHFASMDYPCEPELLEKRNATIEQNIRRTVELAVEMDEIINRVYPFLKEKFVPVIQGWRLDDYMRCIELYEDVGITADYNYFGIGSVCRRNSEKEVARIVSAIRKRLGGDVKLHAFGTKISNLRVRKFVHSVYSADTSAWNFEAMYTYEKKGNMPWEIRILPNSLRYRAVFWIYKTKVEQMIASHNHTRKIYEFLEGGVGV